MASLCFSVGKKDFSEKNSKCEKIVEVSALDGITEKTLRVTKKRCISFFRISYIAEGGTG